MDVAVGVALVLAVTNSHHAALGGGGFALVKMGEDPVKALDFRETAPARTHKGYYFDKPKESSLLGAHAIVFLAYRQVFGLHRKYGKLHWSQLFDEPIRLARKGYFLTGENIKHLKLVKDKFNEAGEKYFLDKNGKIFKTGELISSKTTGKSP